MNGGRATKDDDDLAALLRADEPLPDERDDAEALEVLLPAGTMAALRSGLSSELSSREDEWTGFGAAVMDQLGDRDPDQDLAPEIRAALNRDTQAELDRRNGEWSVMTAAVFRRLREEEAADARRPVEARTTEAIRGEVEGALEAMAPRFAGGSLASEIERRIDGGDQRPAAKVLPLRTRLLRAPKWVAGAVALAAGVALAVMMVGRSSDELGELDALAWADVSVDQVDFEGSVTVVEDDDLAVIWLGDEPVEM